MGRYYFYNRRGKKIIIKRLLDDNDGTSGLEEAFLFTFFIYVIFFTSFSGHRPAQREWARTRLIGPMQGAIPTQSHNP